MCFTILTFTTWYFFQYLCNHCLICYVYFKICTNITVTILHIIASVSYLTSASETVQCVCNFSTPTINQNQLIIFRNTLQKWWLIRNALRARINLDHTYGPDILKVTIAEIKIQQWQLKMRSPWLIALDASLSPLRPGFDPKSIHLRFVLDKTVTG